jgi:nucleoid-associated protein YgaU
MSAQAGVDWKVVAEANNIDNPRLLDAGAVVNLNVG